MVDHIQTPTPPRFVMDLFLRLARLPPAVVYEESLRYLCYSNGGESREKESLKNA